MFLLLLSLLIAFGQLCATPVAWAHEPSTLDASESKDHFVEHLIEALAADWRLNLWQRKERLWKVLDHELDRLGLPRIDGQHFVFFVVTDVSPLGAQFDPLQWLIALDEKLLLGPLSPDHAARLAELLYHELRHVEQRYLLGRWLVAERREAELYQLQLPRYIDWYVRHESLLSSSKLTDTVRRWYGQWSSPHQEHFKVFDEARRKLRQTKTRLQHLVKELIWAEQRAASRGDRKAIRAKLVSAKKAEEQARKAWKRTLPGYGRLPLEVDAYRVARGIRRRVERRFLR